MEEGGGDSERRAIRSNGEYQCVWERKGTMYKEHCKRSIIKHSAGNKGRDKKEENPRTETREEGKEVQWQEERQGGITCPSMWER